ncbi:MAG: hypothetical protein K9J17_17010 [Flavobacteriales bacterium]|nr:hypothetical protein [Flavobacteriales bacterium]
MRLFWLLLIGMAAVGCKENAGCTEFGSENYDPDAVINDGSCISVRDKFIGSFDVSSDCISANYNRTISAALNESTVTISNLADTLPEVEAKVFGQNITIESQSVHPSITVEGAGVFTEDSTLSISYRIRDNRSGIQVIHDCFEVCTKI